MGKTRIGLVHRQIIDMAPHTYNIVTKSGWTGQTQFLVLKIEVWACSVYSVRKFGPTTACVIRDSLHHKYLPKKKPVSMNSIIFIEISISILLVYSALIIGYKSTCSGGCSLKIVLSKYYFSY